MNVKDWLPPAVIISVIIFSSTLTYNLLNKRIDDLKEEVRDIRKVLLDHIVTGHSGHREKNE